MDLIFDLALWLQALIVTLFALFALLGVVTVALLLAEMGEDWVRKPTARVDDPAV